MAISESVKFTVTITGETSGETWRGEFAAKPRLSHRDQLARDRIRRELLGPDGTNAVPRAHNQAEIFSQLAVRLTEAPKWWSEAGNGLDLDDDNIVAEVYSQVMRIEQEAFERVKKAAEDAKAELAKVQ
jgi:hypothetical protein